MSENSSVPGEMDALKVYVIGMVAVSVLGAGAVWWFRGQTEEVRATVTSARGALTELAESRREIQGMLQAYTKNKEDEARDQPLTWFQNVWTTLGIQTTSLGLDPWKVPADTAPDGTYKEEKMGIKFLNKAPLRREQISRLMHRIEHSSSRLRVLTLRVFRAGRDDTLGDDSWAGQCEIGYRYPFARE